MNCHDAEDWKKTIEVELENMKKQAVFSVVELPEGAKAIGSTWVYTEKLTPTGVHIKHKAPCVLRASPRRRALITTRTMRQLVQRQLPDSSWKRQRTMILEYIIWMPLRRS